MPDALHSTATAWDDDPNGDALVTGIRQLPPCFEPPVAAALYALGYAHLQSDRYQQAHDYFRTLLVNDPMERSYLAGLALALAGLQRHEEAMRINTAALLWHPGDPAAMLRQAECLLALRRPAEAVSWLDAVVACGAANTVDSLASDAEQQALAARAAGLRNLIQPPQEERP